MSLAARELDLPPGGIAWDETLELTATDGVELRGAVWRNENTERGVVLLLHGRTEFLEKCAVPAAQLVRRGFAVASIDWRGQGRSQRLLDSALKGHVEQFTDYQRDLQALVAHPSVAGLPGRRLMLAHSMGGAIGLGAVVRGVVAPAAVILSAPMLGIELHPLMRPASHVTIRIARLIGRTDAWPPFGPVDQPYVFGGFEGNVLTGDRAMFDWMVAALRRAPELQLGTPTLGWLDAAFAEAKWLRQQGPLGCPGLCLLGSLEDVVDPDAVRTGATRLDVKLVEIRGARHEVLIEAEPMRSQAWEAIDRFLEVHGL